MTVRRSIDVSKKHRVTLTFLLGEDISPQALAQRIAARCGGSVLTPGDAIRVDHAKIVCVVTDETLSLPSFGYEWRSTLKKAPTRKRKARR